MMANSTVDLTTQPAALRAPVGFPPAAGYLHVGYQEEAICSMVMAYCRPALGQFRVAR